MTREEFYQRIGDDLGRICESQEIEILSGCSGCGRRVIENGNPIVGTVLVNRDAMSGTMEDVVDQISSGTLKFKVLCSDCAHKVWVA